MSGAGSAPAATRRPRASFYALGCKVNQYETREAAADLVRLGYEIVPFGRPADVCVVNTCSVTAHADAKSRAVLRRASRCGDDPLVVATGCYAETDPAAVAALPGVAAVVPNAQKPRLAEIVDDALQRSGRLLFALDQPSSVPSGPGELVSLMLAAEGVMARTRAVIKIQDGCNHFCTFCIIPFTRGRLRSRPPAAVLAEARALASLGYQELVLTGICLGDYGDERGFDRGERDPLAALLEQLAAVPGIRRLRLSSVDPADVTPDLISTMARLPAVCPHLHLSLQSGSSAVLRRMRRRYTAEQFLGLVSRIYGAMPEAGLTCDVIVGYPGESPAEFEETAAVCRESRFLKIHAFPYSPRAGTAAARLDDDVSPAEKHRRVQELAAHSERLALDFAGARLGRTVEVLVEQREPRTGLLTGLSGSYLRVAFAGPDSLRGRIVPVTLHRAAAEGASGAWGGAAAPGGG